LRLDADRTRDELVVTLGEIRARLTPRQVASTVAGSIAARPFRFAIGALVVTAAAGITTLLVRSKHRG
jgi:hypothetical protein